ncbi:uncharacterized protein DEA37_0012684, partial [Paragonimus westermani]
HLQDVNFPDNRGLQTGILIRMNVPEAHWTLEQRRGNPMEPFATRTPLGWVLLGHVDGEEQKGSCVNAICGKTNGYFAFFKVTNLSGIDWLRRHLAPRGIRVHQLTFDDPRAMHIDVTFVLVKPGIALQNPERPCHQTKQFKAAGWNVIDVPIPLMNK